MGGEQSTISLIESNQHQKLRHRIDESPDELNGFYPNTYGSASYWIHGGSYLHWAAHYKKRDCVKVLLELGANVNQASTCGNTPLFAACKNGDFETAKLLIQYGADITIKNAKGQKALDQCNTYGRCICVVHNHTMANDLKAYYEQVRQQQVVVAAAKSSKKEEPKDTSHKVL